PRTVGGGLRFGSRSRGAPSRGCRPRPHSGCHCYRRDALPGSRSQSCQLLRDRVFDVGRRLLAARQTSTEDIRGLPDSVPNFRAEGLDPSQDNDPEHVVPQPSPPVESGSDAVSSQWASQHRTGLARARATLELALSGAPTPPSGLDELVSQLGSTSPTRPEAAEGVTLLRLSLLTMAESLRHQGATTNDPAVDRLRLVAQRQWGLAATLLQNARLIPLSDLRLSKSPTDGALWTGGRFGGHPPPLRPGEPADQGIPGGLRLPTPADLIGQ